ncbi:hypothetical protein GJAV_G00153260 [Gymnothorax javanicus]|nr:hypothetical protein GJAV_G00153260 [Gymnothorax javanicus]
MREILLLAFIDFSIVVRVTETSDTPDGFIPDHILQGSADLKRTWLHDTVAEVVDKFVMSTDITELSANISSLAKAQHAEKERFLCREPDCALVFVYKKARDNHEATVHSLASSVTFPEPAAVSASTDFKKQHTEAWLSFGLLLLNFLDAVKEGDGDRLLRLYRVALVIFKSYGHSQYAYSTFLLTVQINATLCPRLGHSLTWNRFWNGRGGKRKNISLDLHLEHL